MSYPYEDDVYGYNNGYGSYGNDKYDEYKLYLDHTKPDHCGPEDNNFNNFNNSDHEDTSEESPNAMDTSPWGLDMKMMRNRYTGKEDMKEKSYKHGQLKDERNKVCKLWELVYDDD